MDQQVRVCPRCGTSAEEVSFCRNCGLNLARLRSLPTRAEWEQKEAIAAERRRRWDENRQAARRRREEKLEAIRAWLQDRRNRWLAGIVSLILVLGVAGVSLTLPALRSGGKSQTEIRDEAFAVASGVVGHIQDASNWSSSGDCFDLGDVIYSYNVTQGDEAGECHIEFSGPLGLSRGGVKTVYTVDIDPDGCFKAEELFLDRAYEGAAHVYPLPNGAVPDTVDDCLGRPVPNELLGKG